MTPDDPVAAPRFDLLRWDRPGPTARQQLNDVGLGLLLTLFSLGTLELLRSSTLSMDLGWHGFEAYAWVAGVALALCGRRRYPIAVMGVGAALFLGANERLPATAASLGIQVGFFMAMYAGWAWGNGIRRLVVSTVLILVATVVLIVRELAEHWHQTTSSLPGAKVGLFDPVTATIIAIAVVNVLYIGGAVGWGVIARRTARQTQLLRQQAVALAAEQAVNAERAVAEERLRIARDLHDVVAHHVSGIGVQAAGARRLLDRDPAKSKEALGVIEQSSRDAVNEMHQLVSLLRSDEGAAEPVHAPRPGLAALAELAAESRRAGVDIEIRTVGEAFALADSIDVSLFRTAQEAITNVRRHSSATKVDLAVRYLRDDQAVPTAVEVEVTDDGRPRVRTGEREAGGFGLAGIRERASLQHGTVEIGPRVSGGFRVRVRFPQAGSGQAPSAAGTGTAPVVGS